MFEVGLVIAEKRNREDILSFSSGYRFQVIETNPCNGTISLVQDKGLCVPDRNIPRMLDIIHLYFTGMGKREVLRQLRLTGQHPGLFAQLAIVLCEVDAATGFDYHSISRFFQRKCRHRLHIDYFLVLSLTRKTETGDLYITLYSGHEIINVTIETYYRNVLPLQAAYVTIESIIV